VRILGIDPGTVLVGYALAQCEARADRTRSASAIANRIALGAEPVICDAGVIRLKSGTPLESRLAMLYRELSELLEESKPDLLVVEQVFVHAKHARTAIVMGHARGVVLLAAAQRGIPVGELSPAEVKKSLTGNGQATKRQVQQAVKAQCRLSKLPEPPDLADAIAIALCGARRGGVVRRTLLRKEASR